MRGEQMIEGTNSETVAIHVGILKMLMVLPENVSDEFVEMFSDAVETLTKEHGRAYIRFISSFRKTFFHPQKEGVSFHMLRDGDAKLLEELLHAMLRDVSPKEHEEN